MRGSHSLSGCTGGPPYTRNILCIELTIGETSNFPQKFDKNTQGYLSVKLMRLVKKSHLHHISCVDRGPSQFCEMVTNCETDQPEWFCDSLLEVSDY